MKEQTVQVRNGFVVLTRSEIISVTERSMFDLDSVRCLVKAIKRLTTADRDIHDMADQASVLLDIAHNDIDVIREQAEKAGVAAELV